MFSRNATTHLGESAYRRTQWSIDVDVVMQPGDCYVYAPNLWIDLAHVSTILKAIRRGEVALVLQVDQEDIRRGVCLVEDIRRFGKDAIIVPGGTLLDLTFICIRDGTVKKFHNWLWTIWYAYTERVNLWARDYGTLSTPGTSAIRPEEVMYENDVSGAIVLARGGIWGGRWIHRETGAPFTFPPDVVFSPWVRMSRISNRIDRQAQVNAFVDLTLSNPEPGSFEAVITNTESHPEVVPVREPEEERTDDEEFEDELLTQAAALGH